MRVNNALGIAADNTAEMKLRLNAKRRYEIREFIAVQYKWNENL